MTINHSQRYMSLSPWEALITIINDQYQYHLNPLTTTLVAEEPLDEQRLELTIASKRSKALGNLLPPLDQYTFILTRLDLATYYQDAGSPLPVPVSELSELTTLGLADWLTARYGTVFDLNDFMHEELPVTLPPLYELHAHPRSLRWVGTLTVAFAT